MRLLWVLAAVLVGCASSVAFLEQHYLKHCLCGQDSDALDYFINCKKDTHEFTLELLRLPDDVIQVF
jgi:hypothetical protein